MRCDIHLFHIIMFCVAFNFKEHIHYYYPKVYRRAFSEKKLSNFTHDSMYGALCTISVQSFYF